MSKCICCGNVIEVKKIETRMSETKEHECEHFLMTDIAVHGCECGNIIINSDKEYVEKKEYDELKELLQYIASESFDLVKCGYVHNYPSTPNVKHLGTMALMREQITGKSCTIEEIKKWLH